MPADAVSLYESDFVAWTADTAEKIRQCQFQDIDLRILAEEIESLGGSERGEIDSRLTQLMVHLLKWQFQPDYRVQSGGRSWRVSIVNQRVGIRRAMKRSPSLGRYAESAAPEVYQDAVRLAEAETGNAICFPPVCPYTFEQLLDDLFYPE